jgi:hypothetical protein
MIISNITLHNGVYQINTRNFVDRNEKGNRRTAVDGYRDQALNLFTRYNKATKNI